MIGHYVIGLTLVVNIAMRWPSLIPAALIVAAATVLYGEQDSAAGLGMLRRAAIIEWQAKQGNLPLADSRSSLVVLVAGDDHSMTARSALAEVSTAVPATRSLQVDATQGDSN